jgi:hypothetical protein
LEDDRAGEDCDLAIDWPVGFERLDERTAQGELTTAAVQVNVRSAPYAADWTGRLVAEGDVIEQASSDE